MARRTLLVYLAAALWMGCSGNANPDGGTDAYYPPLDVRDPPDTGTSDIAVDTAPSNCTTLTTCATCGAGNNCGWCGADNRCYEGTASGPNRAMCGGGSWIWNPAYCPGMTELCAMRPSSCSECLAVEGCGLCPGMGCMAGTSDGPLVMGRVTMCMGWNADRSRCPARDGGADAATDAAADAAPDVATDAPRDVPMPMDVAVDAAADVPSDTRADATAD